MALVFPNRVWMSTATTGTGTMTLSTAVSGYLTPAEAGVANADTCNYTIIDGADFECGVGTYTAAGTTLSRDTVTVSKIAGVAGTTKLTLSGVATVFMTQLSAQIAAIGKANDFTGINTFTNSGLHIFDTNSSHDLIITPGSDLTADRILTITTGDAARTLTLNSDVVLDSGTYTPTLFNSANLDGSTAYSLSWTRIGNVVSVSGRVDIDPTTTETSTTLGMSIPVASNFASDDQAGGCAGATSFKETLAVIADATNDRVTVIGIVSTATNHALHLSFSYRVI